MLRLTPLLLLVLPSLGLPSSAPPRARTNVGAAGSQIAWTLCPDTANDARNTTFYCSTFHPPLNWLNPVEGEDADIFIRMYPATEGKRVGSLLIEAGGPGDSSSNFLFTVGGAISALSGGQYDIVAMDPRGVNLTSPNMRAFPSDYEAAIYTAKNPELVLGFDPSVPFSPSSDPAVFKTANETFNYMDRRAEYVYGLVSNRTTVEERKSISTAFFARDLAALVVALGDPECLLNYYGPSYGTHVGTTFAAMFPEKVGRMVLDGVVYSPDYMNNYPQRIIDDAPSSLNTTKEFARLCAQSGPVRCALASNTTDVKEGAAIVMGKINALLHKLYVSPIALPKDATGVSPGNITAQAVYFAFRNALRLPTTWQVAAAALEGIIQGDPSGLIKLAPPNGVLVRGDKSLPNENVFGRTTGGGIEISQAILCADQDQTGWDGLRDGSNDEWVKLLESVEQNDFTSGNALIQLAHACRQYKDGAFERYDGPFSVAEGLRPLRNKILFVGNTFDPATPLESAKRMAADFGEENASLLISDGRGHTTLSGPPGSQPCTNAAIAAYFVNGTVPAYGTVCPVDEEAVFSEPKNGAIDPRPMA